MALPVRRFLSRSQQPDTVVLDLSWDAWFGTNQC